MICVTCRNQKKIMGMGGMDVKCPVCTKIKTPNEIESLSKSTAKRVDAQKHIDAVNARDAQLAPIDKPVIKKKIIL